jgi:hypothetical protein
MPHFKLTPLAHATELCLHEGAHACSFQETLEGLRDDPALADALTQALAGLPYPSLFWECAPVHASSLHTPFRCVAVPSDALEGLRPDPSPFAQHLQRARPPQAVTFENLGRDAVLVVPAYAPHVPGAHLASFLRSAGPSSTQTLWGTVAEAALARLADPKKPGPLWISTSGLGVSWLHVRLDARPKYYSWIPYRAWPPSP